MFESVVGYDLVHLGSGRFYSSHDCLLFILLIIGGLVILEGCAEFRESVVVSVDLVAQRGYFFLKSLFGIFQYPLHNRLGSVDNKVVVVGQFGIEAHAGLCGCHVLHASHVLVLCDEYGVGCRIERLKRHEKFSFLALWDARTEESGEHRYLVGVEAGLVAVRFGYQSGC